MNSRKSGTAVGNDYRSWLFNALLGAAPGVGSGSVTTALGGAAATAAVKGARDVLSARALLSSDISKWVATAPRTQNASAINAHLKRLATIGASNSAVASEATNISRYLTEAISQSPGRAAAEDETN
jgi:hypothetical protein